MNLWKIKRRLEQEMRGVRVILGQRQTQKILRLTNIAYEVTRIAYNPFYLIEIGRRQLISYII